MDHEKFDVVVIGGGPAGSSAAFTLASAGLRTCLMDKQDFPRDKLCGGLVTPRAKRIFEETFAQQWDAGIFLSSDKISFFSKSTPLAAIDGHLSLFFTRRYDFDAYLLGLARKSGVFMKLGARVTTLDLEGRVVTLASGESVGFSVLIGADGVNSQVAKRLFGKSFDEKTIGFGLEVEVPRDRMPLQSDVAEIDFAPARWGYGWVFPKKSGFTVGVGGIHRLNPDMREKLSSYLREKNIDISETKVKGHFIPFGKFRSRPGNKNVLLCGDAAGLVDPITGEGIAYAMQSGRFAAVAATRACRAGRPDSALDFYLSDYKIISRSIRQANLWRYVIFSRRFLRPTKNLFAKAFSDASTLQLGFLDVLSGEKTYTDLYSVFLLQVQKAIKKGCRLTIARVVNRLYGRQDTVS
jgi:geranylgeranyl reductase family protein